ncbi:MAG: hypothetical protein HY904_19570 [Deltaproteobacteria bacterium]|nr:hypothetical protein [Deltaproteobacteria bacterium]
MVMAALGACLEPSTQVFRCETSGDCAGGRVCAEGRCEPPCAEPGCTSGGVVPGSSSVGQVSSAASHTASGGSRPRSSGTPSSRASSAASGSSASRPASSSSGPTCTPTTCVAADACDVAACNGSACVHARAATGTACGAAEGLFCDAAGQCVAACLISGMLVPDGTRNPDNGCQECRAAVAPDRYSAVTEGTACADALSCNGAEACSGGECQPGTPACSAELQCVEGSVPESPPQCVQCTADQHCSAPTPRCRQTTGTCVACLGAGDCPDTLTCTVDDCANSVCTHPLLSCTGGTPYCEEPLGCVQCRNDADCQDANACNGVERCSGGSCVSGTVVTCPSSTRPCDPDTGTCVCTASSCTAGSTCTAEGTCQQSYTYTVGASADDALQDPPPGNTLLTHWWTSLYSVNHWGGLRFALTDIGPSTDIVGAVLRLYVDSNAEDDPRTVIRIQDSTDAPAFAAAQNNISTRGCRATTGSWSTDLGLPGPSVVNSPDVAPLLREVTAQSGWSAGHHVVFVLNGPQSPPLFEYRQWDNSAGAYAPALVITVRVP